MEDCPYHTQDYLCCTDKIDQGQECKNQETEYPVRSNLPNREKSLKPVEVTCEE